MNTKGLKGLFIVNGYLKSAKFDELYQMIKTAATKYSISLVLFSNDKILPIICNDCNSRVKDFDFCIFWDKDIMLAKYLEKCGLKVINCADSIEICDDKAKTHIELFSKNIPMPKTIIAPMTYNTIGYTNLNFLDKIENELNFPIVIKERKGSFGMQVYKADNKDELTAITKEHQKGELIFQQFIKTKDNSDFRINMVGNKCIAAMKRIAKPGDFRSNITNGGTMEKYEPDSTKIALCQKVMSILKLDYAGIDIMEDEAGNNYICEVNSNAHFKNIYDCTGINCADALMEYIQELL